MSTSKQFNRNVEFNSTQPIIGNSGGAVYIAGGLNVSNLNVSNNVTISNLTITNNLFTSTGSTLLSSQWGNVPSGISYTNANVGIGTTSPGFSLDISGGARITGSLTTGTLNVVTGASITNLLSSVISTGSLITTNGITTSNINVTNVSSTNVSSTNVSSTNVSSTNIVSTNISTGTISSTSSTIPNIVSTNISTGTLNINSNLNANFNSNTLGSIFTTGGNVGIGSTTPNALLQLANTLDSRKIVLYDTFNNDNQFSGFGINAAIFRYQITNTNDFHIFYAGTSSTSSNELMRITGTGNVIVANTTNSTTISTGNLFTTNISTGTLIANTSTIPNIVHTNICTGTLNINSNFNANFNSNTLGSLFTTSGNVGIGLTTPNAQLQFSNSIVSRKIVLFDGFNNDHQFYGFGINSLLIRYQVDGIGANHIFYAGTSSTSSNELMRITGTGNVIIANTTNSIAISTGNLFTTNISTGTININGNLIANGNNDNVSFRDIQTSSRLDISVGKRAGNVLGGWVTLDPNGGTSGSSGLYVWDGLETNGSITCSNLLVTGLISSSNLFSTTSTIPNFVSTNISTSTLNINSIFNANFNSNTLGSLFTTSGNVGIGLTTPNAPLQFVNSIISRKIVLYETFNNNHEFYGFGINNPLLRYQVDSINSNHIFYAGTSSTSSNELMRITGTGNVIVANTTNSIAISTGNLFTTNISTGTISSTSSTIPNIVNTNISTGTLQATGLSTLGGNAGIKIFVMTGTFGNQGVGISPSLPSGCLTTNILSISGVTVSSNNNDLVPFNYSVSDTNWYVNVFGGTGNVLNINPLGSQTANRPYRISIITSA